MADNLGFMHLPLPMVRQGKPKLFGRGNPYATTGINRNNRVAHGTYIKKRSAELSRFWKERHLGREQEGLPVIETGIPILLEIDPKTDIDFLRGLGFEIVCEIEEGFIIVASEDVNLEILNQKTDRFIAKIGKKCNSPAKVYALCEDPDRLKKILSPGLYSKWSTIEDNSVYLIDIGVSCCGNIELPDQPQRDKEETDEHYAQKELRWKERFFTAYMAWDDLKDERIGIIEHLVAEYNGEIDSFVDESSSFVRLPDSFSTRIRITGKCLRDLVLNFAYLFEVSESEGIHMGISQENTHTIKDDVQILSPAKNSPIVCVIDSGIQEEHRYIAPAVLAQDSKCLVPDSSSVSDEVANGGHGTRVAGAILYPKAIPSEGTYELPCWIRNFKVLDNTNSMPDNLFPPKVISSVVEDFFINCKTPTKIFNHSIGTGMSCELQHMSPWAAEIDQQSYKHDVLFIQAAGNIHRNAIAAYIQAGYQYPYYLDRELSRICDPAQSLFALTVGSVAHCDYETEDSIALGGKDRISPFSRSGPGIWDVIKPEVVEYGGTYVVNKGSDYPIFTTPPEVCPELLRRSPEGPAYSHETVGTSFATPKVVHIAAEIGKIFPDAPALLYRALIAQSARWPEYSRHLDKNEKQRLLRQIGFGIPDLDRATHNNDYRITLITPTTREIGEGEAHIYRIPIPEQLSSVGEDYTILVEITLSYAASPRRTRRNLKNYLSTWVDWCCSRIGENSDIFSSRVLETGASIEDGGNFTWMIGDAIDRGMIDGFSRKIGTLQKDWCTITSNQLSDAFCIAVRGHKGWGSLFKAKYALSVSFEALDQDIPIYTPIRTRIETEVEVEVENQEIEVEMSESAEMQDEEFLF